MNKKTKKMSKAKKKDGRINDKASGRVKLKKDKKIKDKKKKSGFFARILLFFKELKSEFKKIIWPTKKSVFNSTMIVISSIAVVTIFVVLADLLFHNLLKILIKTL